MPYRLRMRQWLVGRHHRAGCSPRHPQKTLPLQIYMPLLGSCLSHSTSMARQSQVPAIQLFVFFVTSHGTHQVLDKGPYSGTKLPGDGGVESQTD